MKGRRIKYLLWFKKKELNAAPEQHGNSEAKTADMSVHILNRHEY